MLYRGASLAISFYRIFISPVIHWAAGPLSGCRFVPSCSLYAKEAIALHGPLKGGRLAFFRICRCHPFSTAGYDPVPHAIDHTHFNHPSSVRKV